jgi:hypothetical protein
MHGDYEIKAGYHLAILEEVEHGFKAGYLNSRITQANRVYFCGGFRAREIITTNYDYLSAPYKILVASTQPKKGFWERMVQKAVDVVAGVVDKAG